MCIRDRFKGEYSTVIVHTQVSLTQENYTNELNILFSVSWHNMDHMCQRSDSNDWVWSMRIYVNDYQQTTYPSSGMLNILCNCIGNKKIEYLDIVLNDTVTLGS